LSPPAHSETTHDMGIHAIEAARDRRVAFSEREARAGSRLLQPCSVRA
jgi:hypothetical protein